MNKFNDFQIKCLFNKINNNNVVKIDSFDNVGNLSILRIILNIKDVPFAFKFQFNQYNQEKDYIEYCARQINRYVEQYIQGFNKHIFAPAIEEPEDIWSKITVMKNLCSSHNTACKFIFTGLPEFEEIPNISEKMIEYLYFEKKMSCFDIYKSCSIDIDKSFTQANFLEFIERVETLFKDFPELY